MSSKTSIIPPLISVILPVYNGAAFLASALDSILNQTLREFELIIIDDGSTDNSRAILEEYVIKDARIKFFSRENRGLANTLNESIALAAGTWIARMDQDDIALPFRFEKQLAYLKSSRADIVGSWVKRFGAADKRVVRLPESDGAIKMALLFESPFAHPAVMMRAAVAKELGYEHTWDKAEDYDLWVRAAIAGWKMANIQEVLLLYRVHASQISTSAASHQLQLSQGIRKFYWGHVFTNWNQDISCIDSVLNTRVAAKKIDINEIDLALSEVLSRCEGEARDVVLSHALRIYFRIAADCPDVVSRWSNLCRKLSIEPSIKTKTILASLRLFRIGPKSRLFIGIRATLIFLKTR